MRVLTWCLGLLLVAPAAVAAPETAKTDLRLIDAVKHGNTASARELLKTRIDINGRQGDGATALHWSAYRNDVEIARALLAAGAVVDPVNELGVTPLWVAATNGSAEMIATLLAAHANPNIAPVTGGTPLMIVARQGNAAAVKSLLQHGANPNAVEAAQSQTALMWATANRRVEVVRLLLDARADTATRTKSSTRSVLLCCARFTADTEGSTLIKQGGLTAIHFAAQSGDAAIARMLIAAGAKVDDQTAIGTTALVIAAQRDSDEVAEVLLEQGADPNSDTAGYTALHWAALRGDSSLVKTLLGKRANPNVRLRTATFQKEDHDGEFAFDKFLMGATPYALAARRCHLETMRVLASGRADVSLALDDGRTPAILAAQGKTTGLAGFRVREDASVEAVGLAIENGVDINAADSLGNTVMHVAADLRFNKVLTLAVERGGRLDLRNKEGKTPLGVALAPPEYPPGPVVTGAALLAHRAEHAKWEANKGVSPTSELLRSLGAPE